MKVEDIIKAVKTCSVRGDVQKEVTGIEIDSRLVKEGDMFVAVKGTQADGHAYIGSAIEKGAKVIVFEDFPEVLHEDVT